MRRDRHQALARAGRRVHDHVRAGDDLDDRLLLMGIEVRPRSFAQPANASKRASGSALSGSAAVSVIARPSCLPEARRAPTGSTPGHRRGRRSAPAVDQVEDRSARRWCRAARTSSPAGAPGAARSRRAVSTSSGSASSVSRIASAYSAQSVAQCSIPPGTQPGAQQRHVRRLDDPPLVVAGLRPRVGKEDVHGVQDASAPRPRTRSSASPCGDPHVAQPAAARTRPAGSRCPGCAPRPPDSLGPGRRRPSRRWRRPCRSRSPAPPGPAGRTARRGPAPPPAPSGTIQAVRAARAAPARRGWRALIRPRRGWKVRMGPGRRGPAGEGCSSMVVTAPRAYATPPRAGDHAGQTGVIYAR